MQTKTVLVSVFVVLMGVMNTFSYGQSNQRRDAVKGGTAGAIIGGIIGHQNDETAEGALIGGAVGAIAGSIFGRERDYQNYQTQRQLQQQNVAYQRGVSMNDIISLTRNRVGDSVIINQIQMYGVKRRIGVDEIIALHQQGVGNRVIDAMQKAHVAGTTTPRPPTRIIRENVYPSRVEPIVIERYHRVYPPRYSYPPYRRECDRRPPRTSFNFHYRF